MTNDKHSLRSDIAILGAGIVGLTAAIALAKQGHHISVLSDTDCSTKNDTHQSLNVRSIALSLSSKQILQNFDCWDNLRHLNQPINDIQVSSKGHWGVTRLNHQQLQCDALGYVIESHLIENELLNKAQSIDNITIYSLSQYQHIKSEESQVTIQFLQNDQKYSLESKLCLICDGAHSKAREQVGFKTDTYDYQQVAIAAHVSGPNMQHNVAFERFTSEGPLAMLPLSDARYGLVWSCSIQQAKQLMALNDASFLEQLQKVFGFRLGRITDIGKRFSFPLIKKTSHKLTKNRCVVLGNAAHNLHPVAGQSLNLALRDIAHLADFLGDLDSIDENLSDYQKYRLKDHQQVIQLGDSLVHLFSNNLPLLNHARSAALALLDITPPLKSDFAWRGMGFSQTAANAMRG